MVQLSFKYIFSYFSSLLYVALKIKIRKICAQAYLKIYNLQETTKSFNMINEVDKENREKMDYNYQLFDSILYIYI